MRTRWAGRASVAALISVALLAGLAGSAAAHTPSATLSCNADNQPELAIVLTNYNSTMKDGKFQNTVSASIDGVQVLPTTLFGGSFSATFPAGSPFVSHTAEVIVLAFDDPQGVNGWTKTFELSSPPCQEPTPAPTATPTEAPTPTPTAPPTEAPTATPTEAPTATPMPSESVAGETATPMPSESVAGITSHPTFTAPPTTSSDSTPSNGGGTALFALFLLTLFGGLGIVAIRAQKPSR